MNVPFPRLRRQRRVRILMYRIVTVVLRAALSSTHKKLTIHRASLKPLLRVTAANLDQSGLGLESRPRVSLVVYLGQVLEVKVRIDLRGADIGMPQQFLNTAQVVA